MPIAILFVMLWSTGFIGAKLGLPYAEPFTFLLIRFFLVTLIVFAWAIATRAPWPRTADDVFHLAITGLLIHALFLCGVFSSMHQGVPAGVTALIVGMQPILTAMAVGPLMGEKVALRQWTGLGLGVIGLLLVLQSKLSFQHQGAGGIIWSLAALLGITAGTLYQKKFCSQIDFRTSVVIQYGVAGLAMLLVAPLFETMEVLWTGEFIFALLWLSLILSVGAIFLLYALIRREKASSVASLFYLVPPCTALIAYLIFGESLGLAAVFGMGIAVIGVALVVR
jgi:drug/metabolite transporter (DMT)-like permease